MASQIIRQQRFYNPITNRYTRTPQGLKKILENNIRVQLPRGILYNTISKRFVLDTRRTRMNINPDTEIFNRKIVRKYDAIINDIENQLRQNRKLVFEYDYKNGKYRRAITLTRDNINSLKGNQDEAAEDSFVQATTTARATGKYNLAPVFGGNREGAFFPYLCSFEGLERYGVYNKYDEANYKDNCLIKALKYSNVLSRDKIVRVKFLCRNGYIPSIRLREIANILDIHISLATVKQKTVHYNKDAKITVNLGLLENHYFINEISQFNTRKIKGDKYSDKAPNISSFRIIRFLLKNKDKYLTPIDRSKGDIIYNKEEGIIEAPTVIDESMTRKITFEEPEKNQYNIAFFDSEACPYGKHTPFLIDLNIKGRHKTFEGFDCTNKFLNYIKSLEGKWLFYAHNLRYDFGFIFETKGLIVKNVIKTGNSFKQVECSFYGHPLIFKDSYSLITMKLADFPKTFGLDVYKDVMPYKLYTRKNIEKRKFMINTCLEYIDNSDHKQFIENCKQLGFDKKVDIIEYAKFYCKKDTEVLEKGFNIFRQQIIDVCDLDITNCVSTPQIANQFLIKRGVFEGCYKFAGEIRAFLQKFVKGGRVMLNSNKMIKKKGPIQDFDAVSLYPSAMARLPGYTKGIPKVIPKGVSKEQLDSYSDYFVRINIKSSIDRQFPLTSKYEDESRKYITGPIENYYACKIELEDLIKYQKIEYEILDGLYFDEGYNNKICEVIKELFEERNKFKKDNNAIEKVYKLLMNSSYGKLLLKPIDTTYKFCYTKEDYEKKVGYHYNQIKDIEKYDNCSVIKIDKPVSHSFNSAHLGVNVLAMSKRIMNEVMCLAEDIDCEMLYTDTDSIHIMDKDIKKLEKAYKNLYKRPLIGSDMGQFHTDFEKINGKPAHSILFIGLGKKSYLDVLMNDDRDTKFHIRMKGIPIDCITNKGDVIQQYKNLYKGKKITYNLLDGGKGCKFNSSGFGGICNHSSFNREIKFS